MPENIFHPIESNPDDLRQYKLLLSEAQASWRLLLSHPEPATIASLKQTNSKHWIKLSSHLSTWLEVYTDIDLYGWKLYASLFENKPFSTMLASLEALTPVYIHTIQFHSSNPKLGLVTQLISDIKGEATICMPIRLANLTDNISWMEFQNHQKSGTINEIINKFAAKPDVLSSEWNALNEIPGAFINLKNEAYKQSYAISIDSVTKQIKQCQKAMETITGFRESHIEESLPPDQPMPTNVVSEQHYQISKPPALNLNIDNDDQALNQLNELVHYYRATQPHSPVSYILEKASKWLKLSLPELLSTVINDDERLLAEIKSRMGLALSNGKNAVMSYPFSPETTHVSKAKTPDTGGVTENNSEQPIADEDSHHLSPNQELM